MRPAEQPPGYRPAKAHPALRRTTGREVECKAIATEIFFSFKDLAEIMPPLWCSFYRRVSSRFFAGGGFGLDNHAVKRSGAEQASVDGADVAQQPAGVDGRPGAAVIQAFIEAGGSRAGGQDALVLRVKLEADDVGKTQRENPPPGVSAVNAGKEPAGGGKPDAAGGMDGE